MITQQPPEFWPMFAEPASPAQRQRLTLEYVVWFKIYHAGESPTLREISLVVGTAPSGVAGYLSKLAADGLIIWRSKAREHGIQVVGSVWAPPPALAYVVDGALEPPAGAGNGR